LQGKVVAGVLAASKKAGVPVAVIAGSVTLDPEIAARAGITRAIQANEQNLPLSEAIKCASELARAAGRHLAVNFP
jgi:glycerate kinase